MRESSGTRKNADKRPKTVILLTANPNVAGHLDSSGASYTVLPDDARGSKRHGFLLDQSVFTPALMKVLTFNSVKPQPESSDHVISDDGIWKIRIVHNNEVLGPPGFVNIAQNFHNAFAPWGIWTLFKQDGSVISDEEASSAYDRARQYGQSFDMRGKVSHFQ